MPFRDYKVESQVSLDARGFSLSMLLSILGIFTLAGVQDVESFRLMAGSWESGNWLPLWTGHLLHYTFEHFLWDTVMFVVFTFLLWREERWRIALWMIIAAPLISMFVFSVHPQLSEYRGLSALDSMLFTRFFVSLFSNTKGWDRWLFGGLPLVALAGKIGLEFYGGGALFVSDLGPGVVPLPSAHLVGMTFGVIWYLVSARRTR